MPKSGPQYKQFHMPAAHRRTAGASSEPPHPSNPGLAPRDELKTLKLAQLVTECLKHNRIFEDAKQIEPHLLLVAPSNRDGSPPNTLHIHHGILESFRSKGFDPTRPQVGICVEFKSPEKRQEHLEHNKRFTKGNTLLPYIDEEKAIYGTLAGSHMNLALRLIAQGGSSPIGDLRTLVSNDKNLEDVVLRGHKWYVLREPTTRQEQVQISLWRNQDQIENHGTSEVELLQTIMSTVVQMSASDAQSSSRGKLKANLTDLVAKATQRTPAKVTGSTMSWLTKFIVGFLEDDALHLVQELVDFHCAKVNPRNLVVATNFFQILASEDGLKKVPLVRHYILLTQYTEEKTRPQTSGPAFAQFLEP